MGFGVGNLKILGLDIIKFSKYMSGSWGLNVFYDMIFEFVKIGVFFMFFILFVKDWENIVKVMGIKIIWLSLRRFLNFRGGK